MEWNAHHQIQFDEHSGGANDHGQNEIYRPYRLDMIRSV